MKGKIVVQLSGGADSALAAIKAKERWPLYETDMTWAEFETEFYGVFVNYNQVCAKQELRCATEMARKLSLQDLRVIELQSVWSGGGMISGEQEGNSDVYTPLRNVALLGATMAYAESIEADIVVTGSKGFSKIPGVDHSYYDSTLAFHKLMEAVWNYTVENKRRVEVIPILAEGRTTTMSKEEVYRELLEHGFGPEDTWSCFRGEEKECGICYNCKVKKEIFNRLR